MFLRRGHGSRLLVHCQPKPQPEAAQRIYAKEKSAEKSHEILVNITFKLC